MTNFAKNHKYFWAIVLLGLITALFFLLKPKADQQPHSAANTATPSTVAVIRIAVPDIGSGENASSGTPVLEHIYLNQLLEKEFADDHIKIEWKFFKGAGPAINEALANQQLDFAFLGDLAAIIGKANGIDTRALLPSWRHIHGYLAVQPDKGYKTVADLKGKRIAIWQGTARHLSFNQFIEYHGLSEKDFRLVNLDPAAQNAALAAKQIDAGWGNLDALALQKKGVVEIIGDSRETGTSLATTQTLLVGLSSFINQHPEITQRLVNTVLKAAYWTIQAENQQTAIQQVTENAKYPAALYVDGFKGQQFATIFSPLVDDDFVQQLRQGVASALTAQLIRQDIQVQQWIEPRFVQHGIEQLGYQQVWQSLTQ